VPIDRVQPLKLEDPGTGGGETDQFPTELNPQEDHLECAGVVFDDVSHRDETTRVWRDGADLKFLDQNNPTAHTLSYLLAGISQALIFGADYQYEVSEGVSTTTSRNFQDKVTLTTQDLTGTYLVSYYCEVSAGSANVRSQVRLYNTTDSTELCFSESRDSAAGLYQGQTGFVEVDFTGNAKTFKVQFASQGGSSTISCRRARLKLWRVS
jgi:hypothetical protein